MDQILYQEIMNTCLTEGEKHLFNLQVDFIDSQMIYDKEIYHDSYRSYNKLCSTLEDPNSYYAIINLKKTDKSFFEKPYSIIEKEAYSAEIFKLLLSWIFSFSNKFGLNNILRIIASMKIGIRKLLLIENINDVSLIKKLEIAENIINEEIKNKGYNYLLGIDDETLIKMYSFLMPHYIHPTSHFIDILRSQEMNENIVWNKGGPDLAFFLHYLYSQELLTGSGFINKIKSKFETKFKIDNLQRMYNNVLRNEIIARSNPKKNRTGLIEILRKCNLYQ